MILGMPVGPKRRRDLTVLIDDRLVGAVSSKYVEVVSKNSRSTSRFKRSAVCQYTRSQSCSSISSSQSIAR